MTRHSLTDHHLCHRQSRHDGNDSCWVRSLRMRQFRHGARDDDPCSRTIRCAREWTAAHTAPRCDREWTAAHTAPRCDREWTAAHTAPSGHRSPPHSQADEQRAGRRRQRGECPQRTRQISTAGRHTSHHTHTHTVTHTHTHTHTHAKAHTHTLSHTHTHMHMHTLGHTPRARIATHARTHWVTHRARA
jgi:hypothetical protein